MIFEKKYYIGKILGITENFEITHIKNIDYDISEAEKKDYGNFIFTRCIGGYKEIITGKKFKYVAHTYVDDYNCYLAPNDTGIMVDANSIKVIPKEIVNATINTYISNNISSIYNYLSNAEMECDSYLSNAFLKKKNIKIKSLKK